MQWKIYMSESTDYVIYQFHNNFSKQNTVDEKEGQ